MMVIADAHLHLFREGFPGHYGRAGGGLSDVVLYETLRQAHGIQKGLVVGYEAKGTDPETTCTSPARAGA
jgi:L-fuconolactonase